MGIESLSWSRHSRGQRSQDSHSTCLLPNPTTLLLTTMSFSLFLMIFICVGYWHPSSFITFLLGSCHAVYAGVSPGSVTVSDYTTVVFSILVLTPYFSWFVL